MGARAVSGHIGVFPQVNVYAVIDDALSHFPLGGAVEVFVRREDAKRFIEEVRATILSSRRSWGSKSRS